jgi:hypothetical protein
VNSITGVMDQEIQAEPFAVLADDPRWNAADRVSASQNFSKSGRLILFLLHIVRCAIEGRTDELTEQQIGVQIFGRPRGYNPSEDNIVRTTARQLRQRLALYYQEEGFAESIRIQVPRGGYVPIFVTADVSMPEPLIEIPAPALAAPAHVQEEVAPAETVARPRLVFVWTALGALLLGAVLALLIGRAVWRPHPLAAGTDPLWAEIFSPEQTTLFVPGDAGLNLYNIFSGKPQQLSLREFINTDRDPIQMENLATKQVYPAIMWSYTSLDDLRLANQITSVGPFRREHYEIHGGQDMTSDSFRNANVILSGAPPYNPWVELFDDKLNFHLVFDGAARSMRVINRHPQPGEQPIYVFQENPDYKLGYGYIALTDNLEGNGKVLLIEGTSMAGVDAAVSFLFNERKMAPIMAKAKTGQGQLSNFEVLLEAPFLKSNAGNVSVVATRFYPSN